jgi:hypothetical protein
MDQAMSLQDLWQLKVDLVEPLGSQRCVARPQQLEPFVCQGSDAVADRRVMAEQATDKH